jgi:hypothetical protein
LEIPHNNATCRTDRPVNTGTHSGWSALINAPSKVNDPAPNYRASRVSTTVEK